MLIVFRENKTMRIWLSCLIVLVISTQTIVASADEHQLHPEDIGFLGMDEHEHSIGSTGIVDLSLSAVDIDSSDFDCEHGHIHVGSASFITTSNSFSTSPNHFQLRTNLRPLLQVGIHTLPFRPPIS